MRRESGSGRAGLLDACLTRRRFLEASLAAAGSVAFAGACSDQRPSPERPNFLLILTDQTRTPGMHWPPGFAEQNLPSYDRLAAHGLTFTQAHCSASMCSPSRACLFTGAYENVNGVQTVVSEVTGEQLRPASEVPNLATMLRAAGYEVVYKGKWDITEAWEDEVSEDLTGAMEETYGFEQWNPPDSGFRVGFPPDETPSASHLATLGDHNPDNDSRYLEGVDPATVCKPGEQPGTGCQTPGYGESILDYLDRLGATPPGQRKPFCLVVSFTNPHDIGFYPNGYDLPGAGYPEQVPDLGIQLPDNFDDPLTTKPAVQTRYREILETETFTPEQQLGYVNFYAELQEIVDRHIMAVLDGLDRNGLTDSTIVFRTADHGELGLSHNLIEKCYTAYKETINLPLIVSNPVLFPRPAVTDALWTHIDLTATIAELAGAQRIGVGVSQVPVLRNPSTSVRTSAVFAMDDQFGSVIPLTTPASHIRALIDVRYTYALYFTASYSGTAGNSPFSVTTPYQLELYDKQADSGELNNLLWQPSPEIVPLWRQLHAELTDSMTAMGSLPPGWPTTIEEIEAGLLR